MTTVIIVEYMTIIMYNVKRRKTPEEIRMKVSREQAAQNRERIVETAAQLFRERGFEGIGIADLMKEAGLTHGGFYGHFSSKEELIAEASARALTGTFDGIAWVNVMPLVAAQFAGALLAALTGNWLFTTPPAVSSEEK